MTNYVDPERVQFEAFKALPRDVPIMMLNVLKFRDKADYDDGRNVTGAEAYAAYSRESAPVFRLTRTTSGQVAVVLGLVVCLVIARRPYSTAA